MCSPRSTVGPSARTVCATCSSGCWSGPVCRTFASTTCAIASPATAPFCRYATFPPLHGGIPFATLALQNGVDIKTVSGMLGHFSAGFTLDTYAHVTTGAQKEAANKIGGVLKAAGGE